MCWKQSGVRAMSVNAVALGQTLAHARSLQHGRLDCSPFSACAMCMLAGPYRRSAACAKLSKASRRLQSELPAAVISVTLDGF